MKNTHTFTFEERLYAALHSARYMAEREPSRELSLVITKLEEACQWNDRKRVLAGLPVLGLDWE